MKQTLKQFADAQHVTYEAVRQQVERYKKELKGHVTKIGRTRYLDDEAIAFLTRKRQEMSVFVLPDSSEELRRLQKENESLKNELLTAQRTIIQLQQDNVSALELKGRCEALLTTQEKTEEALKDAQDKISFLQADTARLRAEKEQAEQLYGEFKKGIFGLYWRRKG